MPSFGFKLNNLKCRNMKRNSVGEDGCGRHVATVSESFAVIAYTKEKTFGPVRNGSRLNLSSWSSGGAFPIFRIVMLDHFLQARADRKSVV